MFMVFSDISTLGFSKFIKALYLLGVFLMFCHHPYYVRL